MGRAVIHAGYWYAAGVSARVMGAGAGIWLVGMTRGGILVIRPGLLVIRFLIKILYPCTLVI